MDATEATQFSEENIFFVDPEHGKTPFFLRDYQKELLRTFDNFNPTLVIAARQMGMTLTCLAYALAKMMSENSYHVIYATTNLNQAKSAMTRFDYMYDFLDHTQKQTPLIRNKYQTTYRNKSVITFTSYRKLSTMQESGDLIILNMFDFCDNQKNIWREVDIHRKFSKGKIVALTNAPKSDSYFNDLWNMPSAETCRFPYQLNPSYNQQKVEEMKKTYGEEQFRREYLGEFIDETVSKDIVTSFKLPQDLFDGLKRRIYEQAIKRRTPLTMAEYLRELIESDITNKSGHFVSRFNTNYPVV